MFRGFAILTLSASAVFAQGISGVIASDAKVELVQEGFVFLEGPVATADGGLYFSDLQTADRTYRMEPDGKITIFREHTNGMNGMALAPDGGLLGVEGTGKRVSRVAPTGNAIPLTEGTAQRPLMAPNDLIADIRTGIYFTDPGPRPIPPGRKSFVYYLGLNARDPYMIDDTITRPNGLTISIDGRKLIVDDTVGDTVYQFEIQPNGTAKNKKPFAKIQDVKAGQDSGADGLCIDKDGRIYIATATGVQVFNKGGKYLGTIKVPRQPSNVAFGGTGKKTLFITAREGLYKVQTLTAGPLRLGK
ncbi:MAG: SMP-30/gluconolactonase/LRE family protein [Bryobacteraceae bacterium]